MNLLLKRIAKKDNYTIGKLYIDGKYFCDTLEDCVRVLGPNGEGKIYGKTAIQEGKYKIDITFSNRFKRNLPLLLNVPFFEGIRIHPGNIAADTHGCILVGINDSAGAVHQSRITFDNLFDILQRETELTIEII